MRAAALPLPWLLGVLLAACGGGETGGDEPAAGVTAAGATEATAEVGPTPARWPRPVPPQPYHAGEVEGPAAVVGTITAGAEGLGTAYRHEPGAACPGGLEAPPPVYPAGPLASAVVSVETARRGLPVAELAPTLAVGACEIEPRVTLATVQAPVRFRATDGEALTLRWIDGDGYRDLGAIELPADGAEVERRPRAPGRLHLRGEPHGGTRGWVVVVDHPYAALTGSDGTFRIEGLPPGEHELTVWHEAFGERRVAIRLEPGAELRQDVSLAPAPDGA